MEAQVLAFIRQFQNEGTTRTFTNGGCYWFAHILVNRFRLANIAYNPVQNHFAARIGGNLYDITGKIENDGHWMYWSDYLASEPLGAQRVSKYCIDKL